MRWRKNDKRQRWAMNPIRDLGRVLTTALGIAIGSAAVVFLASNLHGAKHALTYSSQEASGSDIVRLERRRPPPGTSRTAPGLSPMDVRVLREAAAASRATGGVMLVHQTASARGRTAPIGVQIVDDAFVEMTRLSLRHGRWPTREEEGARVCVLGHEIWQKVFGGTWPLATEAIVLNGAARFVVVGVLEPKPPIGGGDGDGTWRVDRQMFVPERTFLRTIQPIDEYESVALQRPPDSRSTREVAHALEPLLLSLHRGVQNFEFDALARGADIEDLIGIALAVILVGCGFVCTLVGGINVMNAELVVVAERTREYGIRRALGISSRRLLWSVLRETMALTAVASVIGATMGGGAAWLGSVALSRWVTPWPCEIPTWSLLAAIGGAVVSGLLAGWLPARRASSMSIVASLRDV